MTIVEIVCITALAGMAIGTLRGIIQGEIMVKPVDRMHYQTWTEILSPWDAVYDLIRQFDLGLRGHVWFRRYHPICLLYEGCLMVTGIWLWEQQSVMMVAIAGACVWLMFEPAYSYARYGELTTDVPENALGLGIHIKSWIMNIIRLTLVIILVAIAL